MKSHATFSSCRKYRYSLFRIWDEDKQLVLFIGLNPSTADEKEDDPTIRRCINFAKQWGYGGLIMGNLFAFRATQPSDLKQAKEPVGENNDKVIVALSKRADVTVVAWGSDGYLYNRGREVLSLLPKPMCLKINKSGQPAHPLYQPKNLVLLPYN